MLSHLLQTTTAAGITEAGLDKLQAMLQQLLDWGVNAGTRIVGALLIFVIGRIVISCINKIVAKVLKKRNVDRSVTGFVKSLVNVTLTILLLVAVVSKLGVETTSFAALIASAGVAVGLALSGNLQNFAGGVLILLLRPFKVGDYVEAQGVQGSVKDIQIFHTIITTVDNKIIFVPNGALSSGVITNYSKEDLRRVDLEVGVEYGENYDKVEATVKQIIAADKRILTEPAPFVALSSLGASSVNVVMRVWVKSADYWDIYFYLNKATYEVFNKQGIGFPFPQLTVHQAKN